MTDPRVMVERLTLAIARRIVDADYYLARNPDVAAAGVDPIDHFAQCWSAAPLRAPNARVEAAIYVWSPVLVLLLTLFGRTRPDITDCLRFRINQLATRRGSHLQLRLTRALARVLAARAPTASDPQGGRDRGVGAIYPVVRIEHDAVPWIRRRVVAEAGLFAFADPTVALSGRPGTARQIPRPALWCAAIRDASLFGFSQIVSHAAFVVYEPGADPTFRYTSRQCEFVINGFGSRNHVLARVPPEADRTLDEGILLVGRCGANYFHFLIEYATKGYVIEQAAIPADVPLIITDDLFPQEREALAILFPDRELVVRGHARRLDVTTLHVPSVMTYMPDSPTVEFWEVAAVNAASLAWLRARVIGMSAGAARAPSRRLYLGRSAGRNITNADAVEAVFRRHGFEVLNPGALSFAEQVEAFRDASCIAGPVGAAFANLVFATPDTLVLGLVSPFALHFSTFTSLAAFAGCRYLAIPGEHPAYRPGDENKRRSLELTHGDYRIDPAYLETVLKTYL